MADEKIKVLEEKNLHMWFEGSPIAICSIKLALDIEKAEMFMSAKFMNIQPDSVKSVTFDIICYDSDRKIIDCIQDVSYTGFDIPRNGEFAQHRRVPIPNNQTRSVECVLKSLSNITDDLWINDNLVRFDTSLEQQSIFSVQGDYNKQFLEICARSNVNPSRFVLQPIFKESHWLCACGCFNWAMEEECFQCGVGRSWLMRNCDMEVLKKQSEFETEQRNMFQPRLPTSQQLAEEKRIEQEEFAKRKQEYNKQQKKQKLYKKLRVVIGILALVLIIGVGTLASIFYIIPYFKYTGAVRELENGNYDKAIASFRELDGFMDSEDFLLKSIYRKALSLYSKGDKKQAAELFSSISGYSDSQEQYLVSEYDYAQQKFDEGEYMESAEIFRSLGEYSTARGRLRDCYQKIYEDAQRNINKNTVQSLEDAYEELMYIGDYKKSDLLLSNCIYAQAEAYYNIQRYRSAFEKYISIPEINDSKEKAEKMSVLMDLISTAEPDNPAVWECGNLYCKKCREKDTAVYSLFFGEDGSYTFQITCPNHTETVYEEQGRYKIENNKIYNLNYDSETEKESWEVIFEIKHIGSDDSVEGMNSVLEVDIKNPYDDSIPSVLLYGNIVSRNDE